MQRPGRLVGSAWTEALQMCARRARCGEAFSSVALLFLKCLICFTEQYVVQFSHMVNFLIEKHCVDKYFLYILYVYIKFFWFRNIVFKNFFVLF